MPASKKPKPLRRASAGEELTAEGTGHRTKAQKLEKRTNNDIAAEVVPNFFVGDIKNRAEVIQTAKRMVEAARKEGVRIPDQQAATYNDHLVHLIEARDLVKNKNPKAAQIDDFAASNWALKNNSYDLIRESRRIEGGLRGSETFERETDTSIKLVVKLLIARLKGGVLLKAVPRNQRLRNSRPQQIGKII
jgi:hypothetical protein